MNPSAASVITVPAMPSEQDAEIARRFTVTSHYLLHLSIFLRQTYGAGDDLYSGIGTALAGHRPYLKLQRRTQPVHIDRLRRHLEIAWVGEVELRLPESVGSGVAYRYSNAWAPVHAYYATYMLLQAWFDANGTTANDHMATLRTISTQIRDRRLLPAPWSVLADGNALGGACTYVGEPSAGACSAKTEVLTIPIGLPGAYAESEFWARYGTGGGDAPDRASGRPHRRLAARD
jgi:hypothetical protein